jgi:hypothetical protein
MSRLAEVHVTTSPHEADFVRMALVDHGIDCTIQNQNAGFAVGLPSPAAPLILTVTEKHAEEARQIVSAALRSLRLPRLNEPVAMESLLCTCGRVLEIPEGSVAQTIECPYCGKAVEIGVSDSPGAQPA